MMNFNNNVIAPATDVVQGDSRRALQDATFIDWSAMDERLGYQEPDHPLITAPEDEFQIAGRKLGEVFEFITASANIAGMGCRALGMAVCLRPQLFENMTMADLSRKFGMSKQALNKYFSSVRLRFGLKSIYHKSDASVEHYRELRTGKTRT